MILLIITLSLTLPLGIILIITNVSGRPRGIQAQLPILLAEYSFYNKQDIEEYIDLLPCIYDYFEDIVIFEEEKSNRGLFMRDEVADRIIGQCETLYQQSCRRIFLSLILMIRFLPFQA